MICATMNADNAHCQWIRTAIAADSEKSIRGSVKRVRLCRRFRRHRRGTAPDGATTQRCNGCCEICRPPVGNAVTTAKRSVPTRRGRLRFLSIWPATTLGRVDRQQQQPAFGLHPRPRRAVAKLGGFSTAHSLVVLPRPRSSPSRPCSTMPCAPRCISDRQACFFPTLADRVIRPAYSGSQKPLQPILASAVVFR